ncbi:hypothetical protein L1987_17491 [Smallanthus sonchifolius]|uniref:Uncharacterized protein n=1 Tax=Smallanthus sonchifolius TaxID=185202 RepID=A0ACB9IXY4_9ASTR|nr:hypothetical protein L1987_17491 [Smallanthus sonchifolius]
MIKVRVEPEQRPENTLSFCFVAFKEIHPFSGKVRSPLQVLRHYTTSVHLHRPGIGFLGEIQVIFWIYILYWLEEMPTDRTNCHASGTIASREDRTG